MNYHLTSEQETIIRHPVGHHARILAVAGSGKTTTMAHRVLSSQIRLLIL
jgi:DNA helicase-2/ATP-dependent DNA helicase PcrA